MVLNVKIPHVTHNKIIHSIYNHHILYSNALNDHACHSYHFPSPQTQLQPFNSPKMVRTKCTFIVHTQTYSKLWQRCYRKHIAHHSLAVEKNRSPLVQCSYVSCALNSRIDSRSCFSIVLNVILRHETRLMWVNATYTHKQKIHAHNTLNGKTSTEKYIMISFQNQRAMFATSVCAVVRIVPMCVCVDMCQWSVCRDDVLEYKRTGFRDVEKPVSDVRI